MGNSSGKQAEKIDPVVKFICMSKADKIAHIKTLLEVKATDANCKTFANCLRYSCPWDLYDEATIQQTGLLQLPGDEENAYWKMLQDLWSITLAQTEFR